MNNVGFLIIHGFAGTTYDILPLARSLKNDGYSVEAPMIKGHTGIRRDLIGITTKHWMDSINEAYLNLSKKCGKIIVIGFSMGGLIGARIASKYNIEGLILINTPIYCIDAKNIFRCLASDFRKLKPYNISRYYSNVEKAPFYALRQFISFLNSSRDYFKEITCPVMINQALNDDTVIPHKSVAYIHSNLASDNIKVKYYKNGGHVILQSPSSHVVIRNIKKFIDEIL